MEADSIPIYFSTNLRFLRKVNGFTQKELAVLLHIDRSTYAYYEIGKQSHRFMLRLGWHAFTKSLWTNF